MDDNVRGSINNYKGVMLCSRPNEQPKQILENRPFCSRVDPKIQIGLNPVKKEYECLAGQEIKPKQNPVLQRHKEWLNMFKMKMKLKKEENDQDYYRQVDKFNKVKEMAAKDREKTLKMKEDFEKLNKCILNELNDNQPNQISKPVNLTEDNLKKLEQQQYQQSQTQQNKQQDTQQNQEYKDQVQANNSQVTIQKDVQENQEKQKQSQKKKPKDKTEKPQWAYSEKELEKKEDDECDELLDFVNQLDYDKYIEDLEVTSLLKSIKNRVEQLKNQQENGNWKEDAYKKYKEEKLKRKQEQLLQQKQNQEFDKQSMNSQASDGKSVASEKSMKSIQSLKSQLEEKQKGKVDWDKLSQNKEAKASIEERIAKHVADEILRNYKNLGQIHSNTSIRKLLEKEAINQMGQTTIQQPLISICKENTLRKNEIDPNNLPYLHRNPAIQNYLIYYMFQ